MSEQGHTLVLLDDDDDKPTQILSTEKSDSEPIVAVFDDDKPETSLPSVTEMQQDIEEAESSGDSGYIYLCLVVASLAAYGGALYFSLLDLQKYTNSSEFLFGLFN